MRSARVERVHRTVAVGDGVRVLVADPNLDRRLADERLPSERIDT